MKIELGEAQTLQVWNGEGSFIICHRGSVWITEERAPRDIVLIAGESFFVRRPGATSVQAWKPAVVTICRPEAQQESNPAGRIGVGPCPGKPPSFQGLRQGREGGGIDATRPPAAGWATARDRQR